MYPELARSIPDGVRHHHSRITGPQWRHHLLLRNEPDARLQDTTTTTTKCQSSTLAHAGVTQPKMAPKRIPLMSTLPYPPPIQKARSEHSLTRLSPLLLTTLNVWLRNGVRRWKSPFFRRDRSAGLGNYSVLRKSREARSLVCVQQLYILGAHSSSDNTLIVELKERYKANYYFGASF